MGMTGRRMDLLRMAGLAVQAGAGQVAAGRVVEGQVVAGLRTSVGKRRWRMKAVSSSPYSSASRTLIQEPPMGANRMMVRQTRQVFRGGQGNLCTNVFFR